MKKIFNLILAALVIIGAAACTKNNEANEVVLPTEGLSFYAEIANDATRAYIDDADADKTWNTIWETGDAITASADATNFYDFIYDGEKFVCNADGVTSLLGQSVTFTPMNGGNVDSKAGKKAWSFNGVTVENFAADMAVKLTANTSFFRYTYTGNGAITFTVIPATSEAKVFQYDLDFFDSVTFNGGSGENFVGFWTQHHDSLEATLSCSIDGVKCKEKTLALYPGKVYNLGTLTEPVATAYSVPGSHNGWTAGATPMYKSGELCVAYGVTFTDAGTFKVLGNDKWYGADIVEDQWVKASTEGADMSVPAGVYDIYFSEARTMVCVVAAGATVPELPSITWALAGDFNSWGDLIMESTATANLFVAKGVELAAGSEIKVKDSTTWDTSFGRGCTYLAANCYMTVIQGSLDNISIAQSGTYDVYFEYLGQNSRLYLMEANADYSTATGQTTDGSLVPDQSQGETPDLASAWSVSGTHNGWGDTPMVTTTVKNLYIAKSVTLDAYASFKIRKDKAWTEGYGGGIVYMNPNGYIQVYKGGSDISNTAAGTFDIYFDYTNKYLYLVTAGGDYTTVSKQTTEGKEPVQEEPEVTANKLYLKPNSNWKIDGARFAAYFFGGTPGEIWVSMTDTGADGIYEVNIPEGYTYGCNVIFCRMNPGTTANNWNNKWNQTSDLKAPTDGKNLYTVKEGTWDKGGGTWSVK